MEETAGVVAHVAHGACGDSGQHDATAVGGNLGVDSSRAPMEDAVGQQQCGRGGSVDGDLAAAGAGAGCDEAEASVAEQEDGVGEDEVVMAAAAAAAVETGTGHACGSCGAEDAGKYRCPCPSCPCGWLCSVACSKTHKEETGCSGKRPRSEYVSRSAMDDSMLLRDYQLLEEAARNAGASRRDPLLKKRKLDGTAGGGAGRRGRRERAHGEPVLVKTCRVRGTELILMPDGMERHEKNTSWYVRSDDCLLWHVEWVYDGEVVAVQDRQPETLTWRECLAQAGCRPMSRDGAALALQLRMRVPNRPANQPEYYGLDEQATIRDSLSGKVVIEFPTVEIVPNTSTNT